ncbi:hypothetical protein [Brochothrix campestris]|nr:hypothetical protein [Brochothrix campestris]
MGEWFKKIGYTLSTSDNESFHLAPMEGMASGAFPCILNWEGAESIYPESSIVPTITDMVNLIEMTDSTKISHLSRYPMEYFDCVKITAELTHLIIKVSQE